MNEAETRAEHIDPALKAEGVAQAKNYAEKMAIRHTCATSRRGIYQVDIHSTATLDPNFRTLSSQCSADVIYWSRWTSRSTALRAYDALHFRNPHGAEYNHPNLRALRVHFFRGEPLRPLLQKNL